jgi:hypothetical protein
MISLLPVNAESNSIMQNNEQTKSMLFVYHIPDTEYENDSAFGVEKEAAGKDDIISDDITADTSKPAEELPQEEEIDDEEELNSLYSDVLQGYAEYYEGEDDAVTLDFSNNQLAKLNIKRPEAVESANYTDLASPSLNLQNKYSKYNAPEYSISPVSKKNYKQFGKFKTGAVYGQEIYYAELEQSTGVFSSYDFTKKFSVSTSYMKTVNSTNNDYNDNFFFSPSYKINQYFTIRESLSADISKERQKAAVYLSINPFGDKDRDRLMFEFGASQTHYNDGRPAKNQFSIMTNFKL